MNMKTLIELYDERPLENVLATEVFKPQNTIFLCSAEVAKNQSKKQKMYNYINHRHLDARVTFLETKLNVAKDVEKRICEIVNKYPDCAIDVTGGSDAALFAAGAVNAKYNIPAFTYSRKQNTFYNISGALFADGKKNEVSYKVCDFFYMAGGSMRKGRVDNRLLVNYLDSFENFFDLYLRHKANWQKLTTYMQRVAVTPKNQPINLKVNASYWVKGDRGNYISPPEKSLIELEKIGYIHNLKIIKDKNISFEFKDATTRAWLRDVGSVLELYVYKVCLDCDIFTDVVTSAVVDWDGGVNKRDGVTNEIDVMASMGVVPLFISCKTCEIDTDALNELAILRDRFGGKMAKAAIVSARHCKNVTRHRAAELGIFVIELDDLVSGRISKMLCSLMKAK